jgi:hypothetical protein
MSWLSGQEVPTTRETYVSATQIWHLAEIAAWLISATVLAEYHQYRKKVLEKTLHQHHQAGTMGQWVEDNWRQIFRNQFKDLSITVPIYEEVLYRSFPLLMLYALPEDALLDPARPYVTFAAYIVGLMLLVRFALVHDGMEYGIFASKRRHQAGAAVVGFAILVVCLTTGWLVYAILLHSLINFTLGHGFFDLYLGYCKQPPPRSTVVEVEIFAGTEKYRYASY